jgi:hypothetical protein
MGSSSYCLTIGRAHCWTSLVRGGIRRGFAALAERAERNSASEWLERQSVPYCAMASRGGADWAADGSSALKFSQLGAERYTGQK